MADVQTDASSASSVPEPISASDALASLSESEYATWQKTGALPESIQSPVAESTPAEPVAQVASTDASPEPASEPATPEKAKGLKAKARNAELDAEIKELQEKLRLRAALRDELDRAPGKSDVKPAESSPAPVRAIDPTDPEPDPAKYDAGEYDAKYLRDLAGWSGRQAVKADRAEERRQRDAAFVQQAQNTLLENGRKAYPDFDEVLSSAEADGVVFSPAMVDAMFKEPNGHDLAHALLADNRAEFTRIAALPLPYQERAIGRLLERLNVPAGAAKPSLKTLTDNPDPPVVLGNRPAVQPDPIESAIKRKDAGDYIREANARELAARRR